MAPDLRSGHGGYYARCESPRARDASQDSSPPFLSLGGQHHEGGTGLGTKNVKDVVDAPKGKISGRWLSHSLLADTIKEGWTSQTQSNSDPSQILHQPPYHVATLSPDQPLLTVLLTAANNCS
jgi:hypothetical protein